MTTPADHRLVDRLRHVGWAEGVSFLLLLTASVIKRTHGQPLGVQILGPIHGGLFLWYVWSAFAARGRYGWSGGRLAAALLASVLPFGTFVIDGRLRRWADAAG